MLAGFPFSSGGGFFGILLCRFVKIIIFAAGIRSFEAGVEVPSQLVFDYWRLGWNAPLLLLFISLWLV